VRDTEMYRGIAASNEEAFKALEKAHAELQARFEAADRAAAEERWAPGSAGSRRQRLTRACRAASKAEADAGARKLEAALAAKREDAAQMERLRSRVAELEQALKQVRCLAGACASGADASPRQSEWKLSGAAEDLKRFANAAKESAGNYARELQLHAGDAAALSALRTQFDALERAKAESEAAARQAAEGEAAFKVRVFVRDGGREAAG
jgi:colicin import membrane protein